jgi:hypothetical protein
MIERFCRFAIICCFRRQQRNSQDNPFFSSKSAGPMVKY